MPAPLARRHRWVAAGLAAVALLLVADAGASGQRPARPGGEAPPQPVNPPDALPQPGRPPGPPGPGPVVRPPGPPADGMNPEGWPPEGNAGGMNPGGAAQGPGGDAPPPDMAKRLPGGFTAEEQGKVNKAIDDAISFLKRVQNENGSWGPAGEKIGQGHWAAGYTALAGLALVEAGVDPADPQIHKAATLIRAAAPQLDATYEVALAILFLDRLRDPKKDEKLIQMLAARLIAGQTASGGWGYKVPARLQDPVRDPATKSMLTALRTLNPPPPNTPSFRERPAKLGLCIKTGDDIRVKAAAGTDDPEKARQAAVNRLEAAWLKIRPVFANSAKLTMTEPDDKHRSDAFNAKPDNSNTHFALLALWAARRHDVPTERTYALLARRFRTSQVEDGGWAYDYGKPDGRPAMTCVALLALAIGHVLNIDQAADAKLEKDDTVLKAFDALGKRVGAPAGKMDGRPQPNQVGGLYFLWAVERIAVLYDVQQLSGKDWYRWGAEILVSNQTPDGSWANGGYHGENAVVNTCFALMFLKRANLTPDLSKKLVLDTSELTKEEAPKAAPKAEPPPPPTPEPEPVAEEPAPKAEEPAPKREEPRPAAETPSAPPPEEKKSRMPLFLGIGGLVLVGGIVAVIAVRMQKDDEEDEDEDKPKKKGKKAAAPKKKARLITDDD